MTNHECSNHPSDHLDRVADWLATEVALQRRLGLTPWQPDVSRLHISPVPESERADSRPLLRKLSQESRLRDPL